MEEIISEKAIKELLDIAVSLESASNELEWNVSARRNIAERLDKAAAQARETAKSISQNHRIKK